MLKVNLRHLAESLKVSVKDIQKFLHSRGYDWHYDEPDTTISAHEAELCEIKFG